MQLRSDQERAIEKVHGCARSGARRILIVAPTGFGKTVTLSELVRRCAAMGKRAAWYAHRRELIQQAAQTLQRFGVEVGYQGLGRSCRVQVLSVQSVQDTAPEADLVILDEAHHYVSEEWGKLPAAYPRARIVGATATPERGDGEGLGQLFQQLVVAAQIRELQQSGVLVPCEVKRPRRQLRNDQIAQEPVDAYLAHARGERAVLFARSVKDAEDHVAKCLALGVRADVVHERLSSEVRDGVLARFAAGELDVVANVAILTEGWDCPPASVCILARGCGSAGLYVQIVGRVLRCSPGKRRALLIDLRGVSHALGAPDEDREYSLEGEGIRRKGVGGARICRVCGTLIVDSSCECGRAAEGKKPLTIAGEELYDWRAEIRKDPPDRQAERLGKWIREAREKGHQTRSALHKFNGTYGFYPNRSLVAEAERISAEFVATQARIAEAGRRR